MWVNSTYWVFKFPIDLNSLPTSVSSPLRQFSEPDERWKFHSKFLNDPCIGTASSSVDLHAALLMRRCTAVSSMGSNLAMLEAHGGPLKTGGAADAGFSWKASEKCSAVRSSEFEGFGFTFRRTPVICRHRSLGSPRLSEISSSQNWFCLAANSCCFFLAFPIQTNQSESSFVFRYRLSNALIRLFALARGVGWD